GGVDRDDDRRLLALDRQRRVRPSDPDQHGGQREQEDREGDVAPPAGGALDDVREHRRGGEALGRARAAALEEDVAGDRQRDRDEREQGERGRERHRTRAPARRKAARPRIQSPSVISTVWRAPAPESRRATSCRSAWAAAAKRRRSVSLEVSTRTWRPVSGSTRRSSPTLGSSCSRRSRISTAITSWRPARSSSGRRQSRGPRKSETRTTSERWRASVSARRSASPSEVAPAGAARVSWRRPSSRPIIPARPWRGGSAVAFSPPKRTR